MARRWRDLWLEIEFQRRATFPYLQLGLRTVCGTLDRTEANAAPHFVNNRRLETESQHRRAA